MLYASDNIVRVFYILYSLLFLAKTTYFKETFMSISGRDFFAKTSTLFHFTLLKLNWMVLLLRISTFCEILNNNRQEIKF